MHYMNWSSRHLMDFLECQKGSYVHQIFVCLSIFLQLCDKTKSFFSIPVIYFFQRVKNIFILLLGKTSKILQNSLSSPDKKKT